MSLTGLAFPTDIPWERVCYSEDMADTSACDQAAPPKWQSSIAVFRYVPEEDYQQHEGRRLVYYKVTATISSYQPRVDEVEGALARAGALTHGEAQELDKKLNSFAACNGAILQVSVSPHKDGVALGDYPYIADVQPRQRALYEQVTDSNEVASRSLESLNISKGGGTSWSQEVLDVDKGASVSGQVEVSGSYAGVGGGVGAGGSYSHSGEWGTRTLGQQGRSRVETTDASREAREAYSHTTQLTQMYNLLQAYHVGTNRVMFYVAPRPHVLEEPSGFIRGPRRIDGVQDFFLIVNQAEDQEFPCVSVRLDTGHLTVEPEMNYDTTSQPPKELSVDALGLPPGELDPNKTAAAEGSDPVFSLNYDCFESLVDIDQASATAPAGFVVDYVTNIGMEEVSPGLGSTELVIDPPSPRDGRSVTLTGRARGRACHRNAVGDASNQAVLTAVGGAVAGPIGLFGGLIAGATGSDALGWEEVKNAEPGYARRTVRVHWRSEERTKKVGERRALLITTRVLCCCDEPSTPPKIVEVIPVILQGDFEIVHPKRETGSGGPADEQGAGTTPGVPVGVPGTSTGTGVTTRPQVMTARAANDLAAFVLAETARVASAVDRPADAPGRDAELALGRVTALAVEIPRFRRLLGRPASTIEGLGTAAEKQLTEMPLPDSPAGVAPSRLLVAAISTPALAKSLGVGESDALQLQLAALGLGKAPKAVGLPASRRRAAPKPKDRSQHGAD